MPTGGGGSDLLVWDSTAAGAGLVLSNGDHDALNPGGWRSILGNLAMAGSGKHQFEIEVMQIGDTGINMQAGIATRENTATIIGDSASSADVDTHTEIISYTGWVYRRFGSSVTIDGTASTGAWPAVGKIITGGLDLDASPPTFRYYEDGVLGYTINLPTGKTWYPLGSMYTDYKLRLRGAGLTHPIPGYTDRGG